MKSIQYNSLNEADTYLAQIPLGKVVTVEDKKEPVKRPTYFMTGRGTMSIHGIQSIDLLRVLASASKAGQFLLLTIKDNLVYDSSLGSMTWIAAIDNKELTSTQQQYIKQGFKELGSLGIVRRVGNSKYMINPNALVPSAYELAIADWEQAGERKDNQRVAKVKNKGDQPEG